MVQVESWNVTSNLAQGLTLAQLVKYVGKRWKDVAFSLNPRCLLRLLSMLLFAVLNSVLAWVEKIYVKLAGIDLEAIKLHGESIVFIIGAPRSGTTLLQSFLAQSGEFATAKTLDVAFPNSMVLMRSQFFPSLLLKLIEMSIPTTRPMDAMPLDLLTTPQEDEIATNVLSCGYSPYAALSFLGSRGEWREYLRYNSFESFDLDGPEEDLAFAAWQSALKTFLRKLKYLNPGKTLLLKSPCHTARCDLLQSIFGGRCRFVHVHREPKAVIQSSLYVDFSRWRVTLTSLVITRSLARSLVRSTGIWRVPTFRPATSSPQARAKWWTTRSRTTCRCIGPSSSLRPSLGMRITRIQGSSRSVFKNWIIRKARWRTFCASCRESSASWAWRHRRRPLPPILMTCYLCRSLRRTLSENSIQISKVG